MNIKQRAVHRQTGGIEVCDNYTRCEECGGDGWFLTEVLSDDGEFEYFVNEECEECSGFGYFVVEK